MGSPMGSNTPQDPGLDGHNQLRYHRQDLADMGGPSYTVPFEGYSDVRRIKKQGQRAFRSM